MDVQLDTVKVEVLDKFHWENMMSSYGARFLGDTYANIIIESSASKETIMKLTDVALNAWVAGEGFANAITIDASLVVNGENWNNYRTTLDTSLTDELNGSVETPKAPTALEYLTVGTALCLTSQLTLYSYIMNLDFINFRVEQQIDYREENVNSLNMAGYTDIVHTNVLVESDESEERLTHYYQQALSLCFSGEAFKEATDMHIESYLNGEVLQ